MNPIPESNKTLVHANFVPNISIVSIIYKKEKELRYFLQNMCEQSFTGNYELVLINDMTPDNSLSVVDEYSRTYASKNNLLIRVLHNSSNLGNCESRNIGIRNSFGSVIVIIDADCVVNKDFLSNHYNAYLHDDCDAAIGYMNIDSKDEDPNLVKDRLEKLLPDLPPNYFAQDQQNPCGFLNCVTRNFSIRKDFITGDLFNQEYSYTSNPNSGFGWEDIEMGYQLYKRGARIKFIPTTFSVHCTHPPTTEQKDKPLKSLSNFRKLIEKNPELIYIARRWVLLVYGRILQWITSTFNQIQGPQNINRLKVTNTDMIYLDSKLRKYTANPFFIQKTKTLKILTYRWHCAHQYELYKSGHEFTLVTGIGTAMCNGWEYEHRPLLRNVKLIDINNINQKDYDLAILHFDENCLAPENTNGVIHAKAGWGEAFKWFRANINLPKVAICHGTPQFYNQYTTAPMENKDIKVIEAERLKLVNFMRDILVVVNSHQAQREWGFIKSKVIWQGFDPTEFPSAKYNKGILTLGQAMQERPHYRGYALFQEIMKGFPSEYLPRGLYVPVPAQYLRKTNEYAYAKYKNYVDAIREYSIYLNPTFRSPMPRSRGEAMMCGLVTVSVNNHDVDMFIKNSVNGFYSNDPNELREYLLFLLKNPDITRKIGALSREVAIDIFNHDRYLKEWEDIYKSLVK